MRGAVMVYNVIARTVAGLIVVLIKTSLLFTAKSIMLNIEQNDSPAAKNGHWHTKKNGRLMARDITLNAEMKR